MNRRRSGCPINLTLETFGDRWSLIVLRDIMFGGRRTFRSLLTESIEGIASNILADRLKRLTANGLLSRSGDPRHKQRVVYSLTEKAIELVPLMAVMGSWGLRHTLASTELATRAQILEDGGPHYGPSSWRSCGISTWERRGPRGRCWPRCSRPTKPQLRSRPAPPDLREKPVSLAQIVRDIG